MTHPDTQDPNLEAAIDRALTPYPTLLDIEDLHGLREILRDELLRHPVSARLLKQLAPAPEVQRSEERASGGGAADHDAIPTPNVRKRGSR